eukprot:CAMPEP_0197490914 /NCGR_PEP_ID=MMETSP1311-20131121/5332_1 /TAXON_ID=464262 /ORGANISM="Genus nov. species nov., Strain RCC856" /LENGTH=56 /DNA_ID=CAMNT_0043035495 /DNA_START=44 /DNA_END=214 /DNA_ORIENTATION=+
MALAAALKSVYQAWGTSNVTPTSRNFCSVGCPPSTKTTYQPLSVASLRASLLLGGM